MASSEINSKHISEPSRIEIGNKKNLYLNERQVKLMNNLNILFLSSLYTFNHNHNEFDGKLKSILLNSTFPISNFYHLILLFNLLNLFNLVCAFFYGIELPTPPLTFLLSMSLGSAGTICQTNERNLS